jgi:peptidoglycan-N-acetylglucosamine deacetylase
MESRLKSCVRHIENSGRSLFLTFDDGPDPLSTPAVLEVLKTHSVPATFFQVAETAKREKNLTREIINQGHAIGNHSLDHGYRSFFSGLSSMVRWIERADAIFKELEIATVGFRPPAGVRTPELHRALVQLKIPLVLWDKRYYDTQFLWTIERAKRSLERINPGAIILLHDRQKESRTRIFAETLSYFITEEKKRGFQFRALTRDLCATGREAGADTGRTGATRD